MDLHIRPQLRLFSYLGNPLTLDSEPFGRPREDFNCIPDEHITFSAGEALAGRNGACFQEVRRQNLAKTRTYHDNRPHRTS